MVNWASLTSSEFISSSWLRPRVCSLYTTIITIFKPILWKTVFQWSSVARQDINEAHNESSRGSSKRLREKKTGAGKTRFFVILPKTAYFGEKSFLVQMFFTIYIRPLKLINKLFFNSRSSVYFSSSTLQVPKSFWTGVKLYAEQHYSL